MIFKKKQKFTIVGQKIIITLDSNDDDDAI